MSDILRMAHAMASDIHTVAAHESTVLTPADHITLFEALDNPPAPTSRLQEAFARHRQTIKTNPKAIRGLPIRPSSG